MLNANTLRRIFATSLFAMIAAAGLSLTASVAEAAVAKRRTPPVIVVKKTPAVVVRTPAGNVVIRKVRPGKTSAVWVSGHWVKTRGGKRVWIAGHWKKI